MNSLYFLIIINILNFCILQFQENTNEIFRLMLSQKYNILFTFSNNYIYSYNSLTENQITNTQLIEKLSSHSDADFISFAETSETDNTYQQIYIVVKNYLYIFSKDGMLKKYIKIQNMSNNIPSIIIPYKCISNICIIFLILINSDKKLEIYRIKHEISSNELIFEKDEIFDIINSSGENSLSKIYYVTCQIMSISSDKKLLTCFYINENTEIGTIYFDLDNLNETREKLPKFRQISGAKILKSVLYSNDSKALICYINDNSECACLSFNIIENDWSINEYKYIDNCALEISFFSFDFYEVPNEYILTCFSANDEFNSVSFNSNMELKDLNSENNCYCIYNEKIDLCPNEPLCTAINYNENYKMIVKCAMNTNSQFKNKDFTRSCSISPKLIPISNYSSITPFSSQTTNIDFSTDKISQTDEISQTNKILQTDEISQTDKILQTDEISQTDKILQTDEISQTDELPSNYSPLSTFALFTDDTSNISDFQKEPISIINYSDQDTTIINFPTYESYTEKSSKITIIEKTTNKTKEEISNNLDELIKDADIGKVYDIKGNDFEIKISPINFNEYKYSSTHINFLECENTLKRKNNLPPEAVLTVIQMEIYKYDDKSLTNQIEYAIYNDKKIKLDLSVCENDKIEITYSITNTSAIDIEKISLFSNMDVDIFNIKDNFFNDICYPYSNNNSDMILKDRVSDIYQNFSVCDNNCEYNRINISSMTITCNCNIKSNIDTKKEDLKFDKIYLDLFEESSFSVIKCFKLVFNLKNKLNNIGFIIFTILFLFQISIIIYYIINGITSIKIYIINEMKKFNYLTESNSPVKKKRQYIIETDKKNNNYKNKKTRIKDIVFNQRNRVFNKDSNQENMSSSKKNFLHFSENDNDKKLKRKHKLKTSDAIPQIFIFNYPKNKKKVFKLKKEKKINISLNKTINTSLKKLNLNPIQNKEINNKNKSLNNYYLIKIDANNTINFIEYQSKYFLDNFEYEDAIIYDNRSFWRLYFICLMAKENILSTFFLNSPLELKSMRLSIFIFSYSCDFALNSLFYFNENISEKYYYKGKSIFWFNLLNNLTISFFSYIVSFIIVSILQMFTNSKDGIENIFKVEEKKLKKNKKYKVNKNTKKKMLEDIFQINRKLKYKIFLFIILEFIIMLYFYYFVTAFCEVYKNTQISWLIDSFISFLISFPVEFILAFFISLLYKIAIKSKIKFIYNIAMIFYNLG